MRLHAIGVAVGVSLLVSSPAAQDLYAADFGSFASPSSLHRLDPTTGAVIETIGATGFILVTGLAFHPESGLLYAIAVDPDPFGQNSTLLTIDVETGNGTEVGPTGFRLESLAFADDGTLYGWDVSPFGVGLVRIDETSGAGTPIGSAVAPPAAHAIAFMNGRLLLEAGARLYEVDVATGEATLLQTLEASGAGLAFDAASGLMYTTTRNFDTGGTEIRVFDPEDPSGLVSEIGGNGIPLLRALAFDSGPMLDFATEDDFATPIVNGQSIRAAEQFGRLVHIDGFGPHTYGVAAFDSTPGGPNADGSDPDLLVGLGNLLILQENPSQSVPGIYDQPDDAQLGGTMVFDFVEPTRLRCVDLVDICPGPPLQDVSLTLVDVEGGTRTYFVPAGWTGDLFGDGPPGYGTLDLTTLEPQPGFLTTASASESDEFMATRVTRLEVFFSGSGALDNLGYFERSRPMLPCEDALDLSGWGVVDYPVTNDPPSDWQLTPDGSAVEQLRNANPSVFYSDFDVRGTVQEARVRVLGGNDFIGFVLGFQPDDLETQSFLLVDWKQSDQNFNFGCGSILARAGLAVSRIDGIPTGSAFWGHLGPDDPCSDPETGVQELQRAASLGDAPYFGSTTYTFRFEYTQTNLRVYVDGVLEIDVNGNFPQGRFGFYDFSQPAARFRACGTPSEEPLVDRRRVAVPIPSAPQRATKN